MKIDDQLTSLELSKKLYKLKIKIKSNFYWGIRQCTYENNKYEIITKRDLNGNWSFKNVIPAYTASELLEILPEHFTISSAEHKKLLNFKEDDNRPIFPCIFIDKYFDEYHAGYETYNTPCIRFDDKSFVNICAKLLIYLLENKLVEL